MPGWLRVTFSFAYRVSAVCFLGAVIGIISLFYFSRDLPSIRKLETMTRPAQITIVDRHGDLVTRYGQVYGSPVTISELPPHVVQAVLATEDRNFYHHRGVNPVAVLRALVVNIRSGAVRQGGSTITQQLAKNIFLTPERTVKRKVQEMLLSVQLEMAYTKDEILALYLNNVYFGAGTYGLRAAAERYFEKAPSELTVGEAAMLAGLLKAPSRYSPTASPEAARDRARTVLEVMFDAGYLSREKTDTLLSGPIATISQRQKPAPYAADFVMAELREEFGKMQEDVTIHTTIDLKAHERSIASIAALPEKDTRFREDIQVAAIAMEADGAIRLMIGGRSYTESEYNRATHAKRQPGSAFKPFVYMAALEQGWAPNDIILDTPIELNGWTPANYKDKYYGAVKMSEAMARSLNAAAIRLQEETGRPHVLDVARRVGFAGKIDPGAALALGVNETTPLELAKTYAPFANNGYSAEPYVITSIYGKKGNIIYARNPEQPREVMQQDVVIAMNHMLREVVSLGSGRAAQIPGYVTAGKTGTTQDSRDAWFAGHAAGLVGIVWMGKDDYTPMVEGWSPVSGSGTPAILWSEVMQASLNGRPDTPIVPWAPKRPLPSIFDHFRGLLTSDTRAESGPPILYHGAEPRSTIVAEEPVVVAIAEVEEPPVIEVTPIPENPMDRLLAEVMVDETTPMPEVTDLEALLIQARTSQEAAERQAANASGTDEAARPTP
jgi:penicillin-binding protein 1A